ncbi:MAG: cell division protein FtsQ [Arsenophonus endosymbiont of Ceratovacuna japonica]
MTLNWIKDINKFSIYNLVITGERHYTCDDNIKQIILTLGISNTFIEIDINKIKNKIQNIPWIKNVNVSKQWPNKLKIHLVEYKPYAKWNDTIFIDVEGIIFNLPILQNIQENLLMLYGPEGSQKEVLNMYFTMQQQLKSHNFNIKSLSMNTRRAWQLILVNHIKLNIGKKDIKKRLNHFIELYKILKQVTDKRIEYIDLRYHSGAAVGWLPLLSNTIH